jgi:GT2 family glycosyltransferase
LLTRREVIARIGGLDERFGSGNFEDDDFCIRAAQVGFRARIALDVFIHHTGGQTFKAAKIDYRESLLRNWELFKAKWGIPADTPYEKGYRLPPHAAQRSELVVPLPDVGADHRCEDQGRWWQETCGESVEPGDKDKSPAQPAVTEEAPLSVVIVGNGSGLTPLWPSLVQHTKHPLAITVPPSNGNGNGADSAHEVLCPKGWRLTTVDLSGVRILNQLMQSAGDDPVILLSSDIILTPGWLKRLLAALDRDQRIAVIGPTANHGSAPQQVKADYKGTGKALRQFALRRAHRYGGELAEVDSLAPFCLVFNCSACRQIGLLREDLELSAALSDYCARLQRADLTLAVALDAYVHVEQLAPRLKAVS